MAAFEHDHPQPATSGFGRSRETRGSTTHDDDVNPVDAVLADDRGRVRHQATIQN